MKILEFPFEESKNKLNLFHKCAEFTSGKTPLHYAASNGKEKIGDLLIKNGTDVNAVDKKNGQTALHVASKKGKQKFANILIANGANADIVDDSGKTALHFAAQKG